MESWIGRPKPRIIGRMLSDYNHNLVSVLGVVSSCNVNCLTFQLTTADGVLLNVQMEKGPLSSRLPDGQYVELCGKVEGNQIHCYDCRLFSPEMTKDFSEELYVKAVELFHKNIGFEADIGDSNGHLQFNDDDIA